MSSYPFNPNHGPILVDAQITGPARSYDVRLLLDPGGTTSVIDLLILSKIGLDPSQPAGYTQLTTGSAVIGKAPVFVLTRFSALGHHRFGFQTVGHTLPAAALVDSLLGLDFFRGLTLTIDFRTGQITLV